MLKFQHSSCVQHSFLPSSISNQNKKQWARKYTTYSQSFNQTQFYIKGLYMHIDGTTLSEHAWNLKGTDHNVRNAINCLFSYCLSTYADQDRKAKIKTIWNAIASDTFIISHNYSISHSLTYRKTWGTEPKRLKTLRTAYFLKFDHSSLPISILKEN